MYFKFIIFILLSSFVFAETSPEPVIVKDNSGLTDEEIRKIANEKDKTDEKNEVRTKEIIKTMIEHSKKDGVDISSLQKSWSELSPDAKQYDWIQTKSKEWFKGYIKALYKDKLEFDSKEIGLHTFDFDDIAQIKSYQIISVNIEQIAIFKGIIRFKNNKITIIQGDTKYEFDKDKIASFVAEGNNERDMWSANISVSLDTRSGNTNSFDGAITAHLKRRSAKTHLQLDYLGRTSDKDGTQTSDDHRVNEKFDVYITRYFFWTPLVSEFYKNSFKNIKAQYKVGAGLGYVIYDTPKNKWDISVAPTYIRTDYESVEDDVDKNVNSLALDISTSLDIEISKITDLKYLYALTLSNGATGDYSHHMVITLQNELTSWLDFDISGIWDYTLHPKEKSDGITPKKDDFQMLIGLGVEF